jgi:hypothetical protein
MIFFRKPVSTFRDHALEDGEMHRNDPQFEDSRGSAMMISAQPETADACAGSGNAAAFGAAQWLSFAAAPTFAIMALLTGLGGVPPDMLCSAAQDASPLTGMVPMYLLMSAFHSAPWLKLISSRRSRAHGS